MKKISPGRAIAAAMTISLIVILFITPPLGFLKVTSGSMEPALRVGSICLVERICDFKDLRVGDIAVYSLWDKTLVAHRVVRKSGGLVITKGDSNPAEDILAVSRENYFGRVIFSF